VTITDTPLAGVRLIDGARYADGRGWFAELWRADRYRAAGLDAEFVQHNASHSTRGVLRGMHFQHPHGQGKLITALHGSVYDVVVDVRTDSPTFGGWFGCELSGAELRQLWVPAGCAHGFLVLSDSALVHYACTALYDPAADRCLAWDDPDVGIEWPAAPAVVSAKDRAAPTLAELRAAGVLPAS
jgi:dTDP-4-dehydrorhamnose 3,5-epimerase